MLNPKHPLWMPPGSVRAILALLLVGVTAVLAFRSDAALNAEQIVGLVTLALGFYFVTKSNPRI